MKKNFINNLMISRVKSLLEIIKTKELIQKIKAFKKLDNMNISKEMGFLILEAAKLDYGIKDGNGGISSSLISLCMKKYYDEYSDIIKELYPSLDGECKDRVVFLLSTVNNESALNLYVDLILENYENSSYIPISNLYERTNCYEYLFPKLFAALKFKNYKNNILVLFNDYLNASVVPEEDINKNKKILQDVICKIFNEALKYRFTNTFNGMKKDDYLNLRFYLEIAVNIECYVSNKKTNDLLIKLFKKHDNQLKIFILETLIRRNENIDNLDLTEIAKDDASRYALYEYLTYYNKLDLFPEKYNTGEELAKSDLILNIIRSNNYSELPKTVKFIETKEFNNHLYYIFTYKYTYKNNINYDDTTNYILKETGLDKYKNKEITSIFVGLSGGYNIEKQPSLVETNQDVILTSVKCANETIDEVVNNILLPYSKHNRVNKQKKAKKEIKKVRKELIKTKIDTDDEFEPKRKFKFGYILFLLFLILIGTICVCFYYLNNPEYSKIINRGNIFKSSNLVHSDEFKEIDGTEIFVRNHAEYYVLFYKKTEGKNKYYTYIDTLIDNGYKIYYVNLNDDKNRFLFSDNDLNFTLSTERFMKVEDGEFSFYVDGKNNILNEIKGYVDEIEAAKTAEEQEKSKN